MNSPDQTDLLRARIEAAQARNTERNLADSAREAAETAKDFVREHPLATVAGVAALGLAIGAMTKRGRRAGRAAGTGAGRWLGYAAEMGLAYAASAMNNASEAAQKGQDRLEDLSDTVADSARGLRRQTAHKTGDAQDAARRVTREIGKQASRAVRDFKGRSRH